MGVELDGDLTGLGSISSAHLLAVLLNVNCTRKPERLADLRYHVCAKVHLAGKDLKLLLLADRLHTGIVKCSSSLR